MSENEGSDFTYADDFDTVDDSGKAEWIEVPVSYAGILPALEEFDSVIKEAFDTADTLITVWMRDNHITQEELADRMGVSLNTIQGMLIGKRRILPNRIDALSELTGIPVNTLLGVPENDFAGYTLMLRGGRFSLTEEQEQMILDVALLANDYEHLRSFNKIQQRSYKNNTNN